MENDEKKYEEVIKTLKGLQKINAPANFEANLQRKIHAEGVGVKDENDQVGKFRKKEKKSFWENIFVPAKLIPSLGLAAAAVVIFLVVDTSSEEVDNPFLIEPRVREDVFVITEYEEIEKRQDELSKQKSLQKEESITEQENNEGQLRSSELKSSEEKYISGRDKSDAVDILSDEKDAVKEEEIAAETYSEVESTFTSVTESPQPTVPEETSTEMVTGQSITKDELNFRQIQLTEEQQKTVNELKNQVQSLQKVNRTQK
jgi:hypothetical protein